MITVDLAWLDLASKGPKVDLPKHLEFIWNTD